MITHVVLFKLMDRGAENIDKAVEALLGLRGKIPGLRDLDVGKDVLGTGRSYDIALIARFDTLSGLDAYQKHPAHVKVAEYIAKIRESAVAVDYETKD